MGFSSRRPKSGSKSMTNNRKSKTVHKQKNSNNNRKTAASCPNSSNTAAYTTEKAAKTFWKVKKRAKIGFSTVGDLKAPAATKQQQSSNNSSKSSKKQQQRTGSRSNKSNIIINNSKPQKRQQKWQKKTAQKATKAVQTFWKVKSGKGVFFTQQEQGGPNAGRGGGAKDKSRPRGAGLRKCGGRRPVEFRLFEAFFWMQTKIATISH